MLLNAAILITIAAALGLLWLPRLRTDPPWRAMVTPLASIIGSGFLLLGPVLSHAYGAYAPLAMAGLCWLAWGFGDAIRYSIARIDEAEARPAPDRTIERLASATLGLAYVVSVAYYLNLLGAFGLSLTRWNDPLHAKMLTSAVMLAILAVGWTRGFAMLERLEYVSVSLKLAIIAGLLLGLAVYFGHAAGAGELHALPVSAGGLGAVTLGFGLIVTVQGFETSRYMGDSYRAATRIRSMRWAQLFSALIYMIYIVLFAYVFRPDQIELRETALVDMMGIVAPILPALLVLAALSAQFSAAVADTSGSGGLFHELSGGRISHRLGYAGLIALGPILTWSFDIFAIVAYASRAFAAYYALQSLLATLAAHRRQNRPRSLLYALLTGLGVAIVALGRPVEGG
ncbi:amino acid permease [Frigidibacter sp. ROC022]|uniref:amino acid permease n=1 Tax=Frigidibacter sp. ROC022 TaxID=2971796 RepID=UPI00215AD070|nr:amino acid permease [Frigidibacter sp. ROC022]MCR8724042.1 hypothetical protein [Frigidibacter sp. ROC022]